MTWKKRILSVFEENKPDKIPWFPRMQLWYGAHKKMGTLPEKYENWSVADICRDLDVGIHWPSSVHTENYENFNISIEKNKFGESISYETPYGTLRCAYQASEEMIKRGIVPYLVEHPVKDPKDLDAMLFLLDHIDLKENYETFEKDVNQIGEDGIVLAHMGASPCQRFLRELMGFEQGFLLLYDQPPKLDEILQKLQDICGRIVRIIADSPAKIIKLQDNLTAAFHSPAIFKEYYLPFYLEISDVFHNHGKIFVVHGDGEMKPLLDILADSGIDAVEQFTPHPMTRCTLGEALEEARDRYALWGGIPSTLLCDPISEEEFDSFLDHMFNIIDPKDRFILSVGDNVMPEAHLHRLQKVSQRVMNGE